MKLKRIIPLVLALALAIVLFGFSYAYEGTGYADVSEGAAPVSASFSNGSLVWTIYPGEFMGEGLVIAATYNADGKMLDSKTTQVADLSAQRSETVTLLAEDGGTYRVFLLEASTYSPLMKTLQGDTEITDEEKESKLEVVVGDTVFTAAFADTQAAREFAQMLPVTIDMSDYSGFEKVGSLGKTLTTSNSQITTEPGDIILYNGNQIVIFYGSNSWSYTRLAKVDDLDGWAEALGSGSVSVTFRLAGSQQEPPESGYGDGVAIILNMNGTPIHAKLYDNTAAKAFLELLPYTVTVSRATDDLCGTVSEELSHDPAEDQDTWAIGEIGWFDGWFTILCDNEKGMLKRTRTIIGKVDDEDIPVMQAMTGSVEIKVTLDEPQSGPSVGTTETPTVYFSSDISPEGLLAVYEAVGWEPTGKVAVKLSTGEIPASNYLRPELIKDLVQFVGGAIVECNTAYGGSRASTAMHYQVARDHGFTEISNFQILDEDGYMTLPVEGGSVLTQNYVGKAFADYDSYLILSHFKGHQMAGYGGAIKNISIGIASSQGKSWIHSGGISMTSTWGEQDAFLEAMAEAGKSVSDYLGNGDRIVYVNVMNRLSIDCDCNGRPAEPDMHDIGILASTDPVALDQACIDLIYAQKDGDGASLVRRIESLNGLHTLEHAEEIGLGSRTYTLVSIDN